MTDEVQWRGKTLRIVAVESTIEKCESCACQEPCFEDSRNAPQDELGVGLECMRNIYGVLHHWDEVKP